MEIHQIFSRFYVINCYLEKALAKSYAFEKKLDTLLPSKHKKIKVIIFLELQIPTFYSITKVIHQTSDLCTLTDNRKHSAAELVLEWWLMAVASEASHVYPANLPLSVKQFIAKTQRISNQTVARIVGQTNWCSFWQRHKWFFAPIIAFVSVCKSKVKLRWKSKEKIWIGCKSWFLEKVFFRKTWDPQINKGYSDKHLYTRYQQFK